MGYTTYFLGSFTLSLIDIPDVPIEELTRRWKAFSKIPLLTGSCCFTIDFGQDSLTPIDNLYLTEYITAKDYLIWLKHILIAFLRPNKIEWDYTSVYYHSSTGPASVDGIITLRKDCVFITSAKEDPNSSPTIEKIWFDDLNVQYLKEDKVVKKKPADIKYALGEDGFVKIKLIM